MTEQLNIILVPHTHWDREWYQTFQQFRIRLVHAVDKLLDILDRDPDFTHFMLDGQTIVLDDYLEVKPEQQERLMQYIRSGRIQIGPWYVQPDEFLVSGESLVRNLQIGLQQATAYGQPMRAGYVPDSFGHIAQLPQILQGFGIDNAVFWRGVGAEVHKSEFYWSAPDGTKVLVIFLAGTMGYSNARDMPQNPEEFVARVAFLAAPLLPMAITNTLLFMNGSDHLEPQNGLPEAIESANQLLVHLNPEQQKILTHYGSLEINGQVSHVDRIHVRIGTLPQYIEAVKQQIEHSPTSPVQTLSGEMRSSQYSHLLPAVLSTRMWIKQQNTATEHLLERWVEPLTMWSWKLGAPYPKGLVKLAWKYLLQNHPHDSICGCSIDQVHRENSVRFAQSWQIGEGLVTQALQFLASETDTLATNHTGSNTSQKDLYAVPVVVFNPAPGPRAEAVQIETRLPGSLNHAVVVDEFGTRMPHVVLNRRRQELGSMPLSREMIVEAVAVLGTQDPGEFVKMAATAIAGMLGQPENAYVITRITVEEQQPGVAAVDVLLARSGNVSVNQQELLAAEHHVLDLLEREDINMIEFTAIDEARQTIDFIAADLPAYGLKTYWIYPHGLQDEGQSPPLTSQSSEQSTVGAGLAPALAPSLAPTLASSLPPALAPSLFIENEFYTVQANQDDGTLAVIDKQTGAVFTELNRFVDSGDIGDLYTYCPPEHDTLISQPVEPPLIELVSSGPVRSILRISGRWSLPDSASASRSERSAQMSAYSIVSEVSLTPGVHRIDIHTSVENVVKDHRLRVTFPLPYTVENAAAEGIFEVRVRPIAAPRSADVADWLEQPVNTFPQKRFVDVSNGTIGLGVLNRGLPEYEIIHNDTNERNNPALSRGLSEAKRSAYQYFAPTADLSAHSLPTPTSASNSPSASSDQKSIAVTLLRCVEWLSRGDLATRLGHAGPMEFTPEAQCLGRHEFDYALVPHSGDWEAEEALVLREAQAFNTPVRVLVTEQHAGQLPSSTSLLEVEPRTLVVSAIKQSETGQGVIVRIYNPLSHPVEANIRPGFACTTAFVTKLNEEVIAEHQQGLPLHLKVRSGEIVTVLFE